MADHKRRSRNMFEPHSNASMTPRERRIYAAYELAYTLVDFGAAAAFVVGSVLFFWEATKMAGTWGFVIGSILFAAKPAIRLARELRHLEEGDVEDVAEKVAGK